MGSFGKIRFWATGCVILLAAVSCITGGEVVQVKTIEGDSLAGLKASERETLEMIQQESREPKIDPSLSKVIEQTPHYTVSEFLEQYPESQSGMLDYRVGPYDVLNILVYEEPDLTREALRISGDGYISFPLIGRLNVEGMTTSEIGTEISRKLAEEQYLLDAHVSVMVTEFSSKKFHVLGAVQAPGSFPLQASERVMDALSKAGGINKEEAAKRALLVRTLDPETPRERKIVVKLDLYQLLHEGDQRANLHLADQDVLYVVVPERFYIIGQVNDPGSYVIPGEELTLVEAIGLAGGFTRIAARNKTRIVRVEEDVEKIIQVNVDAITEAGKKIQDVPILPGDVIVVPESFF